MYNENDNFDLTDLKNKTFEENSTSSDTYGGSFKDYTYSTYDYNSFYDENYSNSYDKSDDFTDNLVESVDNYGIDSYDNPKNSVEDSNIDSFNNSGNFTDSLISDSYNNSGSNNNQNQEPVSPENDATVYLDKFLDEAIDVYNSNNIERKSKQLNIPAIILISILAISFILIMLCTIATGPLVDTLSSIGAVSFTIAFLISWILQVTTKFTLTIFKLNRTPNYLKDKFNMQYLENSLNLLGKKSFNQKNSYCLTGPSYNIRRKPIYIKYAFPTAVFVFIILNIISYIRRAPDRSVMSFIAFILIFLFIEIFMLFCCFEDFFQLKSGFYNETVNAVCIEVNSRIVSSNGHRHRIYEPILYMRCNNGHKYILVDFIVNSQAIPYVGEITKLKVNSTNPLCYIPLKPRISDSRFRMTITSIFLTLIMYIVLLFAKNIQ